MTAAERQRRYRQNQRASIVIAAVPVDGILLERLIADGHLSLRQSEDRRCIGLSIAKMFEEFLMEKGGAVGG